MELLPSHVLKLRWLLKQKAHLKSHDLDYVVEIANELSDSGSNNVHPITILMIDSMYEEYSKENRGTYAV